MSIDDCIYYEESVERLGITRQYTKVEHRQIAEWLRELKKLREKNTSKKPIKLYGYNQYKCPRCNENGCFCGSDMFGDGVESEYCQECGQKLDWSDTE